MYLHQTKKMIHLLLQMNTMSFTYFVAYFLLVVFCLVDLFLIIKFIEFVYCANIRFQPPLVSSTRKLRQYVINQIRTNYPNAKTICEIGSGFGGLARVIARNTDANVYALENMPFSALVSKILDLASYCKGNKTIWCDAFKYLDNTPQKFDVAVAFLGPTLTPKIYKYKNKIDVLISLDFEIPKLKPKYVLDIGHGCTVYKKIEYPHKLFIYEFK